MRLYLQGYDGQDEWNPTLVQWDTGQVLCVTELEYDTDVYGTPYLHFAHDSGDAIIPVQTSKSGSGANAVYSAQVPNILLESAYPISVYVYLPRKSIDDSAKSRTIFIERISVLPRQNPADEFTDDTGIYAGLSASEVREALTQYVRDLWGEVDPDGKTYREVYESLLAAAQEARAAAEDAQANAESASDIAVAAKSDLITARDAAQASQAHAASSQAASEQARDTAIAAKTEAQSAQVNASSAKDSAVSAKNDAELARDAALSAQQQCQDAAALVTNAQNVITNDTLDGYKIRVASTPPSISSEDSFGTITFVV